MKFAVICPDGAADWPISALGHKTPFEVAKLPNLARLAAEGTVGRAQFVPSGMESGSDICCMALLGFNPAQFHTGRAPLEAKSLGVELSAEDIAFRCNLVTIEDNIMIDFTAGHIKTEESRQLIEALEAQLGGEGRHFYAGVSYRHLLVLHRAEDIKAVCAPPHNLTGQKITNNLPQGDDAYLLLDLMEKSKPLLASHAVNRQRIKSGQSPATQIWLWGCGRRPTLPLFKIAYNLEGAIISAVDLLRSLGLYLGFETLQTASMTGYVDTDYAAKGRYALEALTRRDFVFVHIEAPDECSHQGDAQNKILALEKIDTDIIGPLLNSSFAQAGELRLLVCPDHLTPVALKTHSSEPAPFVAWGPGFSANGLKYNESQAKLSKVFLERGYELMEKFIKGELL